MEQREYVAIVKNSQQISPDDFDTWDETLKLTDDTTIGQIREWYCKIWNNKGVRLVGVRICEMKHPESPKPLSTNHDF